MRHIFQDVRFGLRVLWGSPGFTCVAALTLGLGIACTSTVFSWIDGVLLHPYQGVEHGEELAALEMTTAGAPNGGTAVSWLDYRDYRDRLQLISGVAVRRQCAFTLGDGQRASLAWGELVSGNYFDVMGVKPLLGRFFTGEEAGDGPGAHPVVVISARMWRNYFHSDLAVAGKILRVNRHSLTITGVAPPAFHGSSPVMDYDLWAPVTMGAALGSLSDETFRQRGNRGMLATICRLRTGVPVQRAAAEAAALAASLENSYPKTNRGIGATILPTWEEHNGVNEYLRAPLAILMAISCLVLLIVCANVANLLLARSVARQREFGIRYALGAGRGRVAMQVLTETLVLAMAGAGVGLVMLLWLQGSLISLVPDVGFPLNATHDLNGRILAFTALACVAAALVAGASPALFVFRSNLNEVLKEGSRSDTAGAASRRTRSALVIGEVALATVALVGAGLFVQSFRHIRAIYPGFEPKNVLLGRFFIETAGYSAAQVEQFAERLNERMVTRSGVTAVTYSDFVPLSTTAGPYHTVRVDGYTPGPGESMAVNRALVAPDYFKTMRIPILEGRDFNLRDERSAELVIIVNQTFAARFFSGRSPMGAKVRVLGKLCRVVGLARDSKYFNPAEPARPFFYLPFRQFYDGSPELHYLVRTQGSLTEAATALRRAVMDTDPNAATFHPVPLAEYTEVATIGQKVAAHLMGALGLTCLLLAALGLYSVMSYSVTQRIAEIGIRMAVGARPQNVIRMVVGQGMTLALTGMVAGTVAAFAAERFVGGMLYRVDPADPSTFVLAGLFLGTVALAAAWLPAYRATRIDPMLALRR